MSSSLVSLLFYQSAIGFALIGTERGFCSCCCFVVVVVVIFYNGKSDATTLYVRRYTEKVCKRLVLCFHNHFFRRS